MTTRTSSIGFRLPAATRAQLRALAELRTAQASDPAAVPVSQSAVLCDLVAAACVAAGIDMPAGRPGERGRPDLVARRAARRIAG
jgi:hypothetical protein